MLDAQVCIILDGRPRLPRDLSKKILTAKYIVAHGSQVSDLIVVHAHEHHPVFPQQLPCQLHPRQHHIQPPRMKPPAGFGVGGEFTAALPFHLPGQPLIVADAVAVVVGVDEVLAGVVGRVDVDQLDPAGVALLEQLEHLQVVPLDHHVAGGVPLDAVRLLRPQGAAGGGEGGPAGGPLAVPVEAELLVRVRHRAVADQRLEHVHVHRRPVGGLGQHLREQGPQLSDVVGDEVGGPGERLAPLDAGNGGRRLGGGHGGAADGAGSDRRGGTVPRFAGRFTRPGAGDRGNRIIAWSRRRADFGWHALAAARGRAEPRDWSHAAEWAWGVTRGLVTCCTPDWEHAAPPRAGGGVRSPARCARGCTLAGCTTGARPPTSS